MNARNDVASHPTISNAELRSTIRSWVDSEDRGDTNSLICRLSDLLRSKGLLTEPQMAASYPESVKR